MEAAISVVINTYNASAHLQRVLDTLKGFDEIVVCDMESTDNTLSIALQNGCRTVTFAKKNYNICEVARDFAIHSAASDWVLVVDADELIPTELHDYLYDFISHPGDVQALFIPRKNYTLRRHLPSSYPDYQLRFFNQRVTTWPPVIHSIPKVNGKVEYIPKQRKELAMVHLDDSTNATLRRLIAYTDNELNRRQGEKVTLLGLIFKPMHRFLKFYLFKGGFRYGIPGYVQAYRQAYYKFTVLCKLYEEELKRKESNRS